jgi:hypothetical protein
MNDATYNDTPCDTDDDGDSLAESPMTKGWEWVFCLLVEDATVPSNMKDPHARLNLLVTQSDAEFLLKMDATE